MSAPRPKKPPEGRKKLSAAKILERHIDTATDKAPNTVLHYKSALSRWVKDMGARQRKDFCASMTEEWDGKMKAAGLSANTRSFYLRTLQTAYRASVKRGETKEISPNPFGDVFTGNARTRKRALSATQLGRLMRYDTVCSSNPGDREKLARERKREAIDCFMMSLYLRGIPPADLSLLRRRDAATGYITYRRRKTGQRLTVRVERELRAIIDRRAPNPESPLMRISPDVANYWLKRVGREIGIGFPLTLYCARHTWASMSRDTGTPVAVISAGLGHTTIAMTQTYLSDIDSGEVDSYNRKLITRLNKKK